MEDNCWLALLVALMVVALATGRLSERFFDDGAPKFSGSFMRSGTVTGARSWPVVPDRSARACFFRCQNTPGCRSFVYGWDTSACEMVGDGKHAARLLPNYSYYAGPVRADEPAITVSPAGGSSAGGSPAGGSSTGSSTLDTAAAAATTFWRTYLSRT